MTTHHHPAGRIIASAAGVRFEPRHSGERYSATTASRLRRLLVREGVADALSVACVAGLMQEEERKKWQK